MDETSTVQFNITKGQLRNLIAFAGGVTSGVAYAHTGSVVDLLTSLEGVTGISLGVLSGAWSAIAWYLTNKRTAPQE